MSGRFLILGMLLMGVRSAEPFDDAEFQMAEESVFEESVFEESVTVEVRRECLENQPWN